MAKFFGNGIVWDKEKNKTLCEFKNGTYTTNDERTKKVLNLLKYKVDYDDEIVIVEDEPNLDELKAYCKEQGYKGYGNCKDIESIKSFINKKEVRT